MYTNYEVGLGEYKYQNWEAMFALMEECEVNKIELGKCRDS